MSAVKDFKCNGCGAPLPIPKNSKGHVKCQFCETESVIVGLVKNAEMADKENINSGFPLIASPSMLHRKLVSFLYKASDIPLDVFEKGEVVREEHCCVPAYLFYCNGTSSYTYEAGNVRQHKTAIDLGDRTRVETQNYMEWTQMSGTANASLTVFTSGNKEFATHIQKLYKSLDPSKLYDFDELDFPHDVVTYEYNTPQVASFNEYVKPDMEELLKKVAVEGLKGKDARDLSMGGGSRIDKEIVRVFLGLYHVVFKYDNKEYSFWITGDGERAFHEGLPEDTERPKVLNDKKESMKRELSSITDPKTGGLTFGMWACIVGAFFTYGISLIGAIIFGVLRSKKRKPYEAQLAEVQAKFQKDIDDFEGQASNVVQQFKSQKKALRGIYEGVSGDASAF